jgi:hypothetical protein
MLGLVLKDWVTDTNETAAGNRVDAHFGMQRFESIRLSAQVVRR